MTDISANMEKNPDYHLHSGSESPENLPIDRAEVNKMEVSVPSPQWLLYRVLTFPSIGSTRFQGQ